MYVNLQTHRNEYSPNWPNAQFNLCHEKNVGKQGNAKILEIYDAQCREEGHIDDQDNYVV